MAIATRQLETDPLVARLLQTQEELSRLLERDQREFFLDLLAGRAAECLVLQGRRLGHDLEQPHWPLLFRAAAADHSTPRVAGDRTARLERAVRDALRESDGGGRPTPVIGCDDDAVVVFLPEDHSGGPAALASRVRSVAARRGVPVRAGWGPRCDDLRTFGAGVTRARWVVDVLAGLPGDPAPAAAGYDDLGIYALLYEKGDRDQLADFADRWLGPLREHNELTHTLRVFLETGGPSATAAALFVHISTLKYRLRKIESVLGIDLSDPEACFNLRLAFKILAVHDRLTTGCWA
jgi:sugar diacid utilization regulator